MKKGFLAVLLLAVGPVGAQIACPVMLVDGSLGKDTVAVTVRNTAKLPLERFSLSCAPSPARQSGSACHSQTGVFYPDAPYTVEIAYPGAEKARRVTISLREAVLSSGARWSSDGPTRCRPLQVRHRR